MSSQNRIFGETEAELYRQEPFLPHNQQSYSTAEIHNNHEKSHIEQHPFLIHRLTSVGKEIASSTTALWHHTQTAELNVITILKSSLQNDSQMRGQEPMYSAVHECNSSKHCECHQ